VHLPLDTLQQLRRHRAALAISNELGARTAGAALYRKLKPHFRLIAWVEAADASERSRGVARRVLRRLLIRQIDAFLAVGTTSEEYLQSLGIPKTKIFKAVYATDDARFSREELLRQPGTERRLLYVGQLVERKGVLPFLKVLSGWAKDHPGEFVEFTIAGEGPLRGDLEKLTLPANLKTLFPGACRYEDLPAVYGQAGIFVLPSFADTWAVVVNEAMAAGLPVLGSLYAQAVRELVRDGREGWTFEPDRAEQMYGAIDRMMQTSLVELDRMRVSAQRRALELTPEAAAEFIDAAIVACFRNQK
jgi:glycosyltransferase involved in cell wall biosynthesis